MIPMNDAQTEAVADAIDSALRSNHAMMYEECEAAALAAIAALDIDRIEREAYERGMKDIAEMVEQWYDNYCNHIPQADLMRVLATVMEGLR